MPSVRRYGSVLPAVFAPLCFVPIVAAQSADSPSAADQRVAAGPTVQMSPFEVSASTNDGYRTRETVTGTKIATPLDESPLTIGVINRELLEDISVLRVTDAVAFTQAGVANTGRTWADQETFVFRGYEGAILRNGIRFNAWTDTSAIERVEVARGPSAILYGFVAPGGVVNYVTKKPFAGRLARVKARWGSETEWRGEFDFNTPLVFDDNRLLFRLTGSRSDGDTWIRYQTIHDTVVNPTVALRLTPDTTLTYDFSYRERKGPFERIRFYYLNKRDGWESLVLAPYNEQLGGTVGYDMNPGIAPWTTAEWTRRRSEVRLEHRFNDHLRFLGIASDDFGHVEQLTSFTNFTGARAQGYQNVQVPPAEHILLAVMPIYENVRQHTQYVEANLLAQFETEWFKSDTLFGVSANRSPTFYDRNGYFAPEPSKIGQIDYTLTSPYTVRVSDPLEKRHYRPEGDHRQWPVWFLQGSVYDWGKADLFVTESLSALDNRLHVLGGLRQQQYRELQVERTLPQIGAIYEVVKGISVYGIWSKTAESNGRTVRHRLPRPLSESKAWDAGVKFELLESKLAGSLTYFHIEKTNLAINDPRLIVDYAAGLVDDTVTFTPGSESKGVEVSVQYQPSRNLQMTLSYAHTDAKILPGDPNPAAWNKPLVQTIPDALTFFGRYTFRGGPLDRLAIGAGFVRNWGPVYVDNPVTAPLANEDGNETINAFVRYPFRLFEKDMHVELAGTNLTDDRYLMNGGFSPPREVLLSLDVRF
jgi:iron complex outermembrane recepter protein